MDIYNLLITEKENYLWPDYGEPDRYTEVEKQTKQFQERGFAVCGELYQTIFETAWLMRQKLYNKNISCV